MIDCNGFVGPWPYWNVVHRAPAAVLALMDRHGIEILAFSSTRSIFGDWRQGNEEALELARQHRHRLAAFVSLSPIVPGAELARLLEAYQRRGARGVRLYPQHHGYSLTLSTDMARVLDAAQELGLPVILPVRVIMHWGLPELEPSAIEDTVRRYPKLPFVLSGINYDMTQWMYDVMHRSPNVSVEISGLQGFQAVDRAVAIAGAGAVLFGSGMPLLYPACSVEKLRVARLSPEQRSAVADGNARRLLQLAPAKG